MHKEPFASEKLSFLYSIISLDVAGGVWGCREGTGMHYAGSLLSVSSWPVERRVGEAFSIAMRKEPFASEKLSFLYSIISMDVAGGVWGCREGTGMHYAGSLLSVSSWPFHFRFYEAFSIAMHK